MPGIQSGKTLTCNDLFIKFYDYCQEPPELKDPYEIYYSISTCRDVLCGEYIIPETVDSVPLRSGIGQYYIPELPANLELGKYKVRWKFKQTEDCTWREICMEFVIYSIRACKEIRGSSNRCVCWENENENSGCNC